MVEMIRFMTPFLILKLRRSNSPNHYYTYAQCFYGCGTMYIIRINNSCYYVNAVPCVCVWLVSNVDVVFVPTGPPSPPEPVITAVNSTLLHVSWPPPFTWTNHSITHYNITLTNMANSNEDTTLHLHSNETSFPWSGAGGCDLLVVNVTASSDIGEGQVGQVIGGFPIRE